ncbi:MAG: GTPase HflX [Thermodesulfobacteriota bacterium]
MIPASCATIKSSSGDKDIGKISGNTSGLKTAQLRRLERLSKRRVPPELVISPEMAREMAEISTELNRQLGVLISRNGEVETVILGDHRQIVIPILSHLRSTSGRLKGVRCIHTHLAGEKISQDDLMDLLFLRLDLMSIIMVSNGLPDKLHSVHLVPNPGQGEDWHFLPSVALSAQGGDVRELISSLEQEFSRYKPIREVDKGTDRAILVSVTTSSKAKAQESMDELCELVRSADVQVEETVIQRRHKINPRLILGKGKLSEIMLLALRHNANLLIFDQELNPSQVNSIITHTDLRVIDRTQLILDIFASRALSREGKLQIEMAQLKYLRPRLGLRDDSLSRLTGGIGGRGPGETKLEIDRRRMNDRLARLNKELKKVAKERYRRRSRRRKKDLPVISLVGYTNAGKSTLLNTLTQSKILAEDKLFATLDPTSRRLRFPEDVEVVVTDTVGFIRHLPDELLQAFKATLEELHEADLLIHVIDISNPRFADQIKVVEDILHDLDLGDIAVLKVFNKIDQVESSYVRDQLRIHGGIAISALDSSTFTTLMHEARKRVMKEWLA